MPVQREVCYILQHVDDKYGLIRLKSKEQRLVPIDCCATIGVVSNLRPS